MRKYIRCTILLTLLIGGSADLLLAQRREVIRNGEVVGYDNNGSIEVCIGKCGEPKEKWSKDNDSSNGSSNNNSSNNSTSSTSSNTSKNGKRQGSVSNVMVDANGNKIYDVSVPNDFSRAVLIGNGQLPISIRESILNQHSIHWFSEPDAKGHHYLILNSLGKSNLSPEQVMDLIKANIKQVFPVSEVIGRNGITTVKPRAVFDLISRDDIPSDIQGLYLEVANSVEVTAISPISFTFSVLPGHILKGYVTHGVLKDKSGELWLFQEGRGVANEYKIKQSVNYEIADYMWRNMAQNVRNFLFRRERGQK